MSEEQAPFVFERRIVKRTPNDDGTEDVRFECGPEATFMVPAVQESYGCAQCVNKYVDQHRIGGTLA